MWPLVTLSIQCHWHLVKLSVTVFWSHPSSSMFKWHIWLAIYFILLLLKNITDNIMTSQISQTNMSTNEIWLVKAEKAGKSLIDFALGIILIQIMNYFSSLYYILLIFSVIHLITTSHVRDRWRNLEEFYYWYSGENVNVI